VPRYEDDTLTGATRMCIACIARSYSISQTLGSLMWIVSVVLFVPRDTLCKTLSLSYPCNLRLARRVQAIDKRVSSEELIRSTVVSEFREYTKEIMY